MGTDIYERTAALLILVKEHAPCGHSPAAKRDSSAVIDIAEIAVFTRLLEIEGVGSPAGLIADGQLLAGALRSLTHSLCLGIGLGHGLFAHDMLARLKSVNSYESM